MDGTPLEMQGSLMQQIALNLQVKWVRETLIITNECT